MNRKEKKSRPFKRNETGFHKHAVMELASWVNGVAELPFTVDDKIVFVPDVTVFKEGILDKIYEVVYSNPVDGKKLAMMQYWSYVNQISFSVFEISAEYILAQTEKPEYIRTNECYLIDLNEIQ